MSVSARRDCGYPGISAEECGSRKCCFSDSIPGVAWCFYPIPTEGDSLRGPEGADSEAPSPLAGGLREEL